MNVQLALYLFLCDLLNFGLCYYAPIGTYVKPGSVLLPASRRGRYLANIIRRQAVDGTGILFNKDADRLNAEAKMKADVLKEELIPYIVAEQERRTTLYKRIMTAIQNGEKGVTVAEIRNKPPVYIKRGLFYRCPSNRDMVEPDGSGIMMCEKGVEPSPILYDSCLSAEDRDLFVANNKYFFCNRHKVEGPDLPINGSSPIACAPDERTSLNYTFRQCALEDSDDVVVHFRYYPDKTYKYVTDLDPEREVCDHWRPCQIGYIFSLPTPDQAVMANELWHDYAEAVEEYEKDEFVEDMPDDFADEHMPRLFSQRSEFSRRKVEVPDGFEFEFVDCWRRQFYEGSFSSGHGYNSVQYSHDQKFIYVESHCKDELHIPCKLYVRFKSKTKPKIKKRVFYVATAFAELSIQPVKITTVMGQNPGIIVIPFYCDKCSVKHLRLRSHDDHIYIIHRSVCTIKQDSNGNGTITLDLGPLRRRDFGSYFAIVSRSDTEEENVMALRINSPQSDIKKLLQTTMVKESVGVNETFERLLTYTCVGCELTDVVCKGSSVLGKDNVSARPPNAVDVRHLSFNDSHACVYIGVFKRKNKIYKKVLAVIENNNPDVSIVDMPIVAAPAEGEQFEKEVFYHCNKDCIVKEVYINGIPLEKHNVTRRFDDEITLEPPQVAFYEVTSASIIIKISQYSEDYNGMGQAVFEVEDIPITKNIIEIKDSDEEGSSDAAATTTDASAATTSAAALGGATGPGATASAAPTGTAPAT